jgi:hypothetical protein
MGTSTSDQKSAVGEVSPQGFNGVLISGQIRTMMGDVVGRDQYNFGSPDFEAKVLAILQTDEAFKLERLALAQSLLALRLSTFFVDQMRLLYITTGKRVKAANTSLLTHFVERSIADREAFDTYMQRFSERIAPALATRIYTVEKRCEWVHKHFASTHPLPRDPRKMFREMAAAAGPMLEILREVDHQTTRQTEAVIDQIGSALFPNGQCAYGIRDADDIAMIRFSMQSSALEILQRNDATKIFSIDDDVDGRFAPLYVVIDQWLLNRCKPWS